MFIAAMLLRVRTNIEDRPRRHTSTGDSVRNKIFFVWDPIVPVPKACSVDAAMDGGVTAAAMV